MGLRLKTLAKLPKTPYQFHSHTVPLRTLSCFPVFLHTFCSTSHSPVPDIYAVHPCHLIRHNLIHIRTTGHRFRLGIKFVRDIGQKRLILKRATVEKHTKSSVKKKGRKNSFISWVFEIPYRKPLDIS